jgi:hypothetical protein
MSAVAGLPKARIAACRADFAAQLRAYRDLVAAASKASGMSLARIDAALAAFEPGYFNNLLVALAARFAPLDRVTASAPGDARDEVRLLVAAIVANDGVLAADAAGGYDPARSVLRIDTGDRVALNADDFEAIAQAFLAAIEQAAA